MFQSLKIGSSYLVGFPMTNFTTVYKLIKIHPARDRCDINYTFLDKGGNKVLLTKSVVNSMTIIEWNVDTQKNPVGVSYLDLPPVSHSHLNTIYPQKSYYSAPTYNSVKDMSYDDLYN